MGRVVESMKRDYRTEKEENDRAGERRKYKVMRQRVEEGDGERQLLILCNS